MTNAIAPPEVTPLMQVLRNWVAEGMLPPLDGLTVWDIGCGWGGFTSALLAEGAGHVIATDLVFDHGQIPPELALDRRVTLREGTVDVLAPQIYRGDFGTPPDVLFMHLMTEHVADLPSFFASLRQDIPRECVVFVHHDNYYQPTGHHDHLFLALNPETYRVESKTVPCWTLAERCAASDAHRASLVPWQWGKASKATMGEDCNACNYKLRSAPWAHLLHQRRFRQVWPERMFTTAMNKTTTFQVRQFLLEAGFELLEERRSWVGNEPPDRLLHHFTRQELQTFTVTFLARASMDVAAHGAVSATAEADYRRY